MEKIATERVAGIQRQLVKSFAVAYISALLLSPVWNQCLWLVAEHTGSELDGALERFSFLRFLLIGAAKSIFYQYLVFYSRICLSASLVALFLSDIIVHKFYQIFPEALKENEEDRITIHYTIKRFNTQAGQTDTTYYKKRRRTSQKLNIIQDKIRSEMKKIRRKRRKLLKKYFIIETKLQKDLRCKEILIGDLELRRAAIVTHLTQLKYYVTNSRDELENQRERNKSIPDTIDLYGNLVASSYSNVPPMVFSN